VKRAAIVLVLIVLLAAGAGVAYYLHVKQQSRDVKGSSTVEFVTTQEAVPARPKEPGVAWPTYGHDPQRLRFANGIALAPPFKRAWTYRARTLVEFPPAVAYGRLFFANNAGVLFAIGAKNGRKAWKYVSHRCVAASPAVAGHVVYEAFLNAPPCNRKPSGKLTGELVAFTVGHGRVLWRKKIYPSESSPVVTAGSVFVGDWSGRVYAFKQRTGELRWARKLHGQVKSGVSIAGEQLYVGDYSGHVYALDIRTGRIRWQAKAQRRFGHAGNFYGSPAVAYGRVYIGATDGKMYSFGASSGKLRWSQSTGGFVYASPAVWRDRVFAGSYSHRFFAFDAATGAILWQFKADGPISGSATVVAGRVYFATLKGTTYGLDATSGRLVWTFPDGKYSPVVADAERLYLIGNARLYGLVERRQSTLRKLSASTALRALRAGGFRHVRVIGTRPLALRLGRDTRRARRNVCHIALFGAEVNVRRGAAVLAEACGRVKPR
jgi:outer membrane protein assembly factor BamB